MAMFTVSQLLSTRTTFACHVRRIILGSSDAKVSRIDAYPIIAFVHYDHSWGNIDAANDKRAPVCFG